MDYLSQKKIIVSDTSLSSFIYSETELYLKLTFLAFSGAGLGTDHE